MGIIAKKKLKISELAEECGLPASTIRHYFNEGLLGKPKKSSRNMAYYDREYIPKISLIKHLQDELFLPLRVIKKLLKGTDKLSFDDYNLILEVRKRLAEHTDLLPEMAGIPISKITQHLAVTADEMEQLESLGLVSPSLKNGDKYYDEKDYRIIKSLSDIRALGFSPEVGFSVDRLEIYLEMVRDLVEFESRMFVERITEDQSADEIVDLIKKGLPAANELVSSLRDKFMTEILNGLEESARDKS